MSRVHQGQSPSYQRKIIVREARSFDRLMFRCAKIFHDRNFGDGAEQPFLDRAYIRRWKNKIYKYLEKEESITNENFENFQEEHIVSLVEARFKNEDTK